MSSLSVLLLINGCSVTGHAHHLSNFLNAKMLPVTVGNKHNKKQLFSINQLNNISDKLFLKTKIDPYDLLIKYQDLYNPISLFKNIWNQQCSLNIIICNHNQEQVWARTITIFEKYCNGEGTNLVLHTCCKGWIYCADNAKSFHHKIENLGTKLSCQMD